MISYIKWLSTFLVLSGILLTNLNIYPLNIFIHGTGAIGWSLAGILSVITGWRYVSRQSNPQVLSKGFVFIDIVLALLVCTQVYLGDMLVWIYGLHTVPVVQAVRDGLL